MRRVALLMGVFYLACALTLSVRAADEAKKKSSDSPAAKSASAATEAKPVDQAKASDKKPKSEKAKAKRERRAKGESESAVQKRKEAENPAVKKDDAKAVAKKEAEKPAAKKDDAKTVAKKEAEKPAAKKKATVVQFTLRGDYPEGPTPMGMFGDTKPSMSTVLSRITGAAEDSSVAAVVLKIEGLEIGMGKINEIRGAIAKLRQAKKPVYAMLTGADTSEYLVASACDEVVMVPSGMLMLPGVRAEMTFYKGLFDKVGVQFDVLQQGKYKGAGEPYSRNSMSPALRESMTAIVDDAYDALSKTIAQDRKTADYRVKTLIDQGLFTAATAKSSGLVDQLYYADQWEAELKKRLKVDEVSVVTDYKKKKVDTDFSGVGGMVKLMELMFGGDKPAERATTNRKIAVVYAVGPIMEGKSKSDMWGNQSVGSTTIVTALRKAADDTKVVAVVLRIDSPGGSAIASDLIWREVVRMKKPVVASMSDVAGSGGYYIAMGARKIIAEPDTITGSIGVIGGKFVAGKLFDKLGVNTEVIARGKQSGGLSMLQPFSQEERAAWTVLLEDTYRQFVAKAAEGRRMPVKKLEELAQGRIYSGRMAVANGLIDRIGTLADAVAEAKKLAGVKPDDKLEIQVLPTPRSFLEQLFGDPSVSSEFESTLGGMGKILGQVQVLKQVFSQPAVMILPCDVKLR
jgi:protease IV